MLQINDGTGRLQFPRARPARLSSGNTHRAHFCHCKLAVGVSISRMCFPSGYSLTPASDQFTNRHTVFPQKLSLGTLATVSVMI